MGDDARQVPEFGLRKREEPLSSWHLIPGLVVVFFFVAVVTLGRSAPVEAPVHSRVARSAGPASPPRPPDPPLAAVEVSAPFGPIALVRRERTAHPWFEVKNAWQWSTGSLRRSRQPGHAALFRDGDMALVSPGSKAPLEIRCLFFGDAQGFSVFTSPPGQPCVLVRDPSSDRVAVGMSDGSIFFIDPRGTCEARLRSDGHEVGSLAFSRDGSVLVARSVVSTQRGTQKAIVTVWDSRTKTKIREIEGSVGRGAIAVSDDASTGFEGDEHGQSRRLDLKTGKVIDTFARPYPTGQGQTPVLGVWFLRGDRALTVCPDHAFVWNLKDRTRLSAFGDSFSWIDLSPDGRTLAALDAFGELALWDVDSATLLDRARWGVNGDGAFVSWSADGKTFAAGKPDGEGAHFAFRGPPRTRHEWALAAGGILTRMRWQERLDLLGGNPRDDAERVERVRGNLKDGWGVESRESGLKVLAWLRDEGHRTDYDKLDAFVAKNRELVRKLLSRPGGRDQLALGFVFAHQAEIGAKSLLAWDLGRLIDVAGWCYVVGYLTEDEAWAWIMPAARRLQNTYSCWDDLGRNYCLGRHFWDPKIDDAAERAVDWLESDAASPWAHLAWTMDLGN